MSDADYNEENFPERDLQIIEGLRSSDQAVRDAAAVLLEKALRNRFEYVLRGIALRAFSPAAQSYLDYKSRIDKHVADEIWQETTVCLFRIIRKDNFNIELNLMAYIVTIASRRLIMRWKKDTKNRLDFSNGTEAEQLPLSLRDILEDSEELRKLLREIERFYLQLKEEDQTALRIGMQWADIKKNSDSEKESMKVLAEKIRLSGAWKGRIPTIERRYYRLREKLQKFLRDRGYDV